MRERGRTETRKRGGEKDAPFAAADFHPDSAVCTTLSTSSRTRLTFLSSDLESSSTSLNVRRQQDEELEPAERVRTAEWICCMRTRVGASGRKWRAVDEGMLQ
jgi:hypothetical protein